MKVTRWGAAEFLVRAAYIVALFPFILLSRLPHWLLLATVGRCCYFFTYSIIRYRYQVVLQNLSRAFPEKPYAAIDALAKDFYWHFACLMVEIIQSVSISKQQLAGRIHVANADLLKHYHSQAKPMIAILGHYGNWESLHILPTKLSLPVNALYKPLSNRLLCRMVRHIRSRFGMQLIPAEKAARLLMKAEGEAALSLFIADQFPGWHKGHPMELLHQPTTLFAGAEKLAKAIDAVVFYAELQRDGSNGWNVHFSLITDQARETMDGQITRCFGERLQETIRRAPAYWLWSHKRWK
ncbi:lysophospholipid acyltransferase family protein [Parapedobacter sp. ISTM3]|uniref:KDO2-lipid IV(A) lauroyltransferase n=1 Tax=Parapedobacter luteus TaxID=623280 RepID=A0A1T5ELU4_9SPHI|nr:MULTISPECIES: lysophospholipid acyltransferase family protein [Parapedobacter]MBK1441315.1 lysophospholipid acyltransferase family protein [Parapedobacter sp. ISTM3]SKB84927.1 KDO2-lipid IV(A) lauroyltransferase [Parapedobacter luteus]